MHLENRLIAMLDVLGFSGKIQDPESLRKTTTHYAELITEARGFMFSPEGVSGSPYQPPSNFEYGQFVFDTLILVSHPFNIHTMANFVMTTGLLMEKLFEAGYPLRGSIGKGSFCMDSSTQIFLSDTFKRLKNEEDNQQWTGCTLLPEVEELVIEALLGSSPHARPTASNAIHRMPVPFKKNTTPPTERWCINWSHLLSPAAMTQGLEFLKGDACKYLGTTEYLGRIHSMPDDISRLPLEFHPAVTLKAIKARASVRFKLEDEAGNGTEPGCDNWTITFGYPELSAN